MFSTQTRNINNGGHRLIIATEDNSETVSQGDATLEDAAASERDYLRRRLHDELQREPTEEELNEWLREHTAGY